MESVQSACQKLNEKETRLLQQIRTVDAYLQVCMDHTYKHSQSCDVNTAEDIMTAINDISNELRTELLFVRFEKAIAAGRTNPSLSS
ncbi:hypothetical protein PV433_31430 [Paenibacillus sp. GYB004]|uniref:hypothetical protein n=1 Tax=Paenibacillus sp. GYB004 TaxID=2994393 RepID=UPI002F96B89B